MSTRFEVNGESVEVDVDPNKPLLWVLREDVGLTGTKYGCGVAACGACTVHLDGQPVRTCITPVRAAEGRAITTIEGLGENTPDRVQQAWVEHQIPQCGYCQSGMIMAVSGLLAANPNPSDDDIDAAITNICRCGTYPRIRAAIRSLTGQGESA